VVAPNSEVPSPALSQPCTECDSDAELSEEEDVYEHLARLQKERGFLPHPSNVIPTLSRPIKEMQDEIEEKTGVVVKFV